MSTYKSCLEVKTIKAALIKKNASVMELNNSVGKIKLLSTTNPNLRQFTLVDKELETNLEQLKTDNHLFVQHILHASATLSTDSEFMRDQESIRATQFAALSEKSDFLEILENKNLIPKIADQVTSTAAAAPTPEIATLLKELAEDRKAQAEDRKANAASQKLLLTELSKAQAEDRKDQKSLLTELSNNQAAATKAATGPKPSQPFFHSKGDATDYLAYKSFIKKFEYFTISVENDVDKLWWLFSSIKGDAYELIKYLSLEEANYNIALERLNKTYLDVDKIKQSIINHIYTYKNPSPDKNYSNVLQGLISLENHLAELKVVHKLDCYEPAANKIVSHIIFNNLPGPLKNELMNECKVIYPTLAQIFENVPKVIEKVNLISGNAPNYPKETSEKSKANSESQSVSESAKPFINVNMINEGDGTPGASNNVFIKKPCRFCKDIAHASKHCPQVTTSEARWKIIKDLANDKKL